ncbi:MAG: rod shape-determining protein MreC [Deltaproteobacteria bacterium]|nr:rod shape-determining protein MreC [Deltaproteobacteria bacterium]
MLFPSVNRQKSWLFFLLVILISLNLYFHFTFSGSLEERSRFLDGIFARALYPLQKLFDFTETSVHSGATSFSRMLEAESENKKMRVQIEEQELRLYELEKLRADNARLKGLVDFKQAQPLNFITARVIGRDASIFFKTIEIDRGFEDGIDNAMPVVSPAGVVGRVLRVGPKASNILLVTDINSKMDAVVQRSRTRVIVGGSVEGALTLRFLPRRFDLRQGDELVTSGLGNFFPPGFKIGVVLGLAQDPNLVLQQAELEAAVDFDSLEEVFVVKQK